MRTPSTAVSLLVVLLSSSCMHAQQAHGYPTLQQGTAVPLQLDETLNSSHARVGQRVAFEVTADVTVQNHVVIPAGSSALGTVALVSRHGWTGHMWHERSSRLDVNVDAVRLPSGQIVPLCITQDGEVPLNGSTIASSGQPVATNSQFSSAKRQDTLIPEGTRLRAYVRRDTVIVQQTASVSN